MTRIYRVLEDGTTPLMSSVICKDEEKELQDLLERNPQLLAGEQISPDDPRRWLLIKREMDVPDPQSGAARWSVDFLFGDQDAVLTFVECKRSEDTRARREVIGQVLDYAANAHRLWTADLLREHATRSAAAAGKSLADAIAQLGANATDVAGDYFDRAMENLKKNELRIVLFLESAPVELKSLVEFLNRDLTTVEVLIVEAKQYQADGIRVVAPTLWGYTGEIRFRKEHPSAATPRRVWNEKAFFGELSNRLEDDNGVALIRNLYNRVPSTGCVVTWGSGQLGTFNIRLSDRADPAMMSVTTKGSLILNFGSLKDTEERRLLQQKIAQLARQQLGLALPDGYENRYPSYSFGEWAPRSEMLIGALAALPR